ncbi:MAG TPA: hypothetical protein VFB04_07715 [Terriglobales bacterium]|nr:hypothetical protein [Terriglobales bacterium]
MKNSKFYRQGDVAIQRIGSFPEGIKKAGHENGRVILAHGEVTGHAHSFSIKEAQKFTAEDGTELFEVKGSPFDLTLPILQRWRNQVKVRHPKKGIIEFNIDDVEIVGDEVRIKGDFGLLAHDEHHAHGVPAGLYQGGGADNKVRQREYTPQGLRPVGD